MASVLTSSGLQSIQGLLLTKWENLLSYSELTAWKGTVMGSVVQVFNFLNNFKGNLMSF